MKRTYVESYINVAFIIEIDMQLLKFSHVKKKYGPLGRVKSIYLIKQKLNHKKKKDKDTKSYLFCNNKLLIAHIKELSKES